jgi:multiple sugar transport system substrate-binding protein
MGNKLLALILVLAFLMGAMAASAEDLYSGERLTLQMMVWNSSDTYIALNEMLRSQFPEMAQKLDIEVIIGGDGDAGIAQKLRLLLASGEKMPDLVRLNYTQFEEFAAAGLLYDMSEAVAPYRQDIIPSVLNLMTYTDGGIYCLPQEVKPKIWYYRKDIFDEAGVDPAQVKTVEDYIEAARTVNEKFPGKYIENYLPPENAYDLLMLLSGNGGRFTDDEGNFVIASDESVKRAFEIIKSYNDSGYFAPISEWSADWQAAFTSETLVSQLIGSWMKQHLISWCPEQAGKWACALWPEEIREGSEAGMGIWVVMKNSGTPELSADILAKYSFDQEFRRQVYAYNGIIPPLESVKTDPVYTAPNPYFGETLLPVTFEALETLKVYPYTPTFSAEQAIALQYLNDYVSGSLTVEEALQKAQDDMINQIGNAYNAF